MKQKPALKRKPALKPPGPVAILLSELSIAFQEDMETVDTVKSVVSVLADEIVKTYNLQAFFVDETDKDGANVIELMRQCIAVLQTIVTCTSGPKTLMQRASLLHNKIADTRAYLSKCRKSIFYSAILDSVAACASAIRFSFEKPCQSRHLAHAGQVVCDMIYGFRCFDKFSMEWRREWLQHKVHDALALQGFTLPNK